MKTNPLCLAALLLLAALPPVAANTVEDILNRLENQKVKELTAYLEANAEAEDRTEALSHLIDAHSFLGNNDKLASLLEQRYDAMDKGPDANLGDLMGNVVQPLVQTYVASDQKQQAQKFLDRVKKDTADNPMASQIGRFLDQLGGELNAPSQGDVLEIAFTDLEGNSFDLAAMKGKVVLVDFWATWCGPCIAEMPNVIAAYKKYHEQGFEIVGISLDQDEESLRKYIEKEEMPWPQFFDGKGWQNEFVAKYGIRGIPATFLVGKDGKVAASNLRGPALESKLAELLK